MNGPLRVDFNYCSVEVGIGHALNWNETHFSPQQGREENEGEKGETGYCILIEPSSGTKFSQRRPIKKKKESGLQEKNTCRENDCEAPSDLYDAQRT